jgi:phosphoribosyl-ATP pyrophosphohydrolase/phosphoribosyl-AMP cyclohydrolase/histidinol dehydrogenase
MATPLLVSFDPSNPASNGLSLKQIAYFGRVLIKVSSVAQAEDFLRQNFRLLDVYIDATAISASGDLVDILNAGAAKIFISIDQLTTLSQEQSVPSSRIVAYATSNSQVDSFQSWVGENSERKDAGLCTESSAVKALVDKLGFNPEAQNLYRAYSSVVTEETLKDTLTQGAVSIVSAQTLTLDRNQADGKIAAASLVAARAVADQSNGLYATTVTDERGVCLGLVWSSDESISEALRTGTGVYQSRKRGLWYKGQSSGDVQELIRVGFDCDSDCLVFVVNQIGRGNPSYSPSIISIKRTTDSGFYFRLLSPGYS